MKIFNYLFFSLLLLNNIVEANPGPILKCGWYSWEPYQYVEQQAGSKYLTGLDVHILNAIVNIAGYKVTYEEISWQQHQERLKLGTYDIAMGATKIDEREKHYYFTEPYRESIDALFILTDSSKKLTFRNVNQFIAEIKQKKFKLGVTEGYFYSVPELNDFINDKSYHYLIVKSNNTIANMSLLEAKKIDGFLADHVNGTTIAWRKRMHEKIKTYEISRSPIYFMLSKNSLSIKDLKNINEAISSFRKSSDYNAVFKTYLIAPLLLQNIDKKWFYLIDIIGTIAFALSGIIIAYHMRATLFTTITLAMLPAIGGGMMRDIIVGRRPLGVLQTPDYLFAVFSTVFICYVILQCLSALSSKSRFYPRVLLNKKFLVRALDTFDALGLAAFTVIGTKVAVISKCEPLWLWGPLLAAITGAGGGVIRDLLRPDRHVTSFMGELYAEVAIIWSLFLSIFLHFHHTYLSPDEVLWAIIITIIGVFVTRMGASIFNLKGPQLSSRLSV